MDEFNLISLLKEHFLSLSLRERSIRLNIRVNICMNKLVDLFVRKSFVQRSNSEKKMGCFYTILMTKTEWIVKYVFLTMKLKPGSGCACKQIRPAVLFARPACISFINQLTKRCTKSRRWGYQDNTSMLLLGRTKRLAKRLKLGQNFALCSPTRIFGPGFTPEYTTIVLQAMGRYGHARIHDRHEATSKLGRSKLPTAPRFRPSPPFFLGLIRPTTACHVMQLFAPYPLQSPKKKLNYAPSTKRQ